MGVKKRILILADTFDEYCQSSILNGITQEAQGKEIDIITLPLVFLGKVNDIETHYFFVKEYICNSYFDGIIVFTGALTEHTSEVLLKALFTHTTLPIVSVAGALKRDCDIVLDNTIGITQIIDHFITEHNVKKIAYIVGPKRNKEAQERFEAYQEGLKKNNLPLQKELIFSGNYSEESGMKAVSAMINSRVDFDALLCADDYTAIGAIKELNRNGIAVPDKVKVAGFDDVEEAYLFSPSLSTVHQPFDEMGRKAFVIIQKLMQQETVDSTIVLDSVPIFRESCSCDTIEVEKELIEIKDVRDALTAVSGCSEELFFTLLLPTIQKVMGSYSNKPKSEQERYRTFLEMHIAFIWNNYVLAQNDQENTSSFLHTFTGILNNQTDFEDNYTLWEFTLQVFSSIIARFETESGKSTALNEMIIEARSIYEEHLVKSSVKKSVQQNSTSMLFREAYIHIVNCMSVNELLRTLADEMRLIPFDFFGIALFNNETNDSFANQDTTFYKIESGRVSPATTFNSGEILPKEAKEETVQNTVWLPLAFRNSYYGYLLLSISDDYPSYVYEELRHHLSLSLAMMK